MLTLEECRQVGVKGQEKGQKGNGYEEGCKVISLTLSNDTGINFYVLNTTIFLH